MSNHKELAPPQGELEEQLERLFWVAMQAEAIAVATIGRGITPAFHAAASALIAQREQEAARLAQISLLELLLEPGGYTDGDGMREEMRDRLAELRGKE